MHLICITFTVYYIILNTCIMHKLILSFSNGLVGKKKCRLLKFKKNSELRSWLKQLLPYSFNYCFIVCYSFSASVLLLHTS